MVEDFIPGVSLERRRVSVRTPHGVGIAKKLARITLLEHRINVDEFMTSLIYVDGWYVFSW